MTLWQELLLQTPSPHFSFNFYNKIYGNTKYVIKNDKVIEKCTSRIYFKMCSCKNCCRKLLVVICNYVQAGVSNADNLKQGLHMYSSFTQVCLYEILQLFPCDITENCEMIEEIKSCYDLKCHRLFARVPVVNCNIFVASCCILKASGSLLVTCSIMVCNYVMSLFDFGTRNACDRQRENEGKKTRLADTNRDKDIHMHARTHKMFQRHKFLYTHLL